MEFLAVYLVFVVWSAIAIYVNGEEDIISYPSLIMTVFFVFMPMVNIVVSFVFTAVYIEEREISLFNCGEYDNCSQKFLKGTIGRVLNGLKELRRVLWSS